MKLRPGSIAWLMRHEIRMVYFGIGGAKGKARGIAGLSFSAIAFCLVLWQAVALVLVWSMGDAAAAEHPAAAMILTGVMVFVCSFMLSQGLSASVEALFERGDLDLLLSSPLPTRSVFAVRLAAVAFGVGSLYLMLFAPFANAGLLLGQVRWLAIYPIVISLALLTGCLAMALTLGLVRLIGVRRTRVVAQLLAALSGAVFFLLSQMPQLSRGSWLPSLAPLFAPGAALGPEAACWAPGRALLGSPLPLTAICVLAALAYGLMVNFLHRSFARGLQESVGRPAASRATPSRFHFRASLLRNIVLKEWRLIWRDPQLISQVLMQLLYMMPICFSLFARNQQPLIGVGFALPFLCASLTGSLGWLAISAEDAPDLLAAAPCAPSTIRRAKMVAITVPPLAVVIAPLAWLATSRPTAGAIILVAAACATACAAMLVLFTGKPRPRSEFKQRQRGNLLNGILEAANAIAWGALAAFLATHMG